MTSINLLPPDKKQLLARAHLNDRLAKLGVLTIAVVGASILVLTAYVQTLNEQRRLTQSQIVNLENNLKPFDALMQEALFVHDRGTTTDILLSLRRSWTKVLDDIAQTTPGDVQVTNFTPALKSTAWTFNLSANASSRASMLNFKNALEAATSFENLTVERSDLVGSDTDSRVTFTVTGTITKDTGGAQ